MAKRPLVALLIETSNSYARGLLRGIYAYLREHHPWLIYLPELGRGESPPHLLKNWSGDGIIARIENIRIARAVRDSGSPAVDLSAGGLVPELPCVETDNQEIARLALDHLYERGFRNLAYCGDDRFAWSVDRGVWFARLAAEAECSLDVYRGGKRRGGSWEQEERELTTWVRGCPNPAE